MLLGEISRGSGSQGGPRRQVVGTWRAEVGSQGAGASFSDTCGHFPREGCFRPLRPDLERAWFTQEEPAEQWFRA